ncbi:hypothetical protein PFISCL1PPCAC_18192, partial [Pristionchus fissidentatus]
EPRAIGRLGHERISVVVLANSLVSLAGTDFGLVDLPGPRALTHLRVIKVDVGLHKIMLSGTGLFGVSPSRGPQLLVGREHVIVLLWQANRLHVEVELELVFH